MADQAIQSNIQDYYGKQLSSKEDLKSKVQCSMKQATRMKEYTQLIHEAVKNKYYGCGLVAPEHLQGLNILDLGCGSGMDCYMLSKLAGPSSHITGIDMTDEQLETARDYVEYHRLAFGYEKANTEFLKGVIEDLRAAGIQEDSQDVVISNCVVNLTADKRKTLSEVYRALKVGGEFYFSDHYVDKQMSDSLRQHKELWGECLSGALYWKDLFDLAKEVGFCTPLLVEASPVAIDDPKIIPLLKDFQFVAVTYRLFKCSKTESTGCMSATYKGGLENADESFQLSSQFEFKKGVACRVPAQIGQILKESRFSPHFSITAESDTVYDMESEINPFAMVTGSSNKAGCCAK